MAQLDPIFANDPSTRNAVRMVDGVFAALSRPAYQRQPEWMREEIVGLDEDITCCEQRIAELKKEIPALQRELLEQQRDLAEHKLTRYEKQAELASKTGGAA